MSKRFACALLAILALSALLPAVGSLVAKKKQEIPFEGMSLVYCAIWDDKTDVRTVSVLRYDAGTNHVTTRDSAPPFVAEVDLDTRELVGYSPPIYVEYWIETDIKMGSQVKILHYDAEVIGSMKMCVDGRVVDVWQLQDTYEEDGVFGQDTWYYDKETGLWVAAAWVEWDSEPVIGNWGGHLVSTNVVLGKP